MSLDDRLLILLRIERTYRRTLIFISLIIFTASFALIWHPREYILVIIMTGQIPLLFLEWRKTRLLLSFNKDLGYKRWVWLNYCLTWLAFLFILIVTTVFMTCSVSGGIILWLIVSVAPIAILGPLWIDQKLQKIDSEHVSNRVLSTAHRERLKNS